MRQTGAESDPWVDIVPDCRFGESKLNEANFHMLPYSNRIRDGKFNFEGKAIELENGARHAIHGALRKLPWMVENQTDASLHCSYDSTKGPNINWPWPIHATIKYELQNRKLLSVIELTNKGESAMPAGGGWHPYFLNEVLGSNARVQMDVSGIFPDEAGDCLPDGAPVTIPQTHNYTQLRFLEPDQRIDCCLSGFKRHAHIQWTEAGIALAMQASANCEYLVFFNPDAPHFAIEPVTNANDAFNLYEQGIESGVQILAPGETLQMTFSLELRDVV